MHSFSNNCLTLLSIGLGAVIGAWLRWGIGLWLNPLIPAFPLGTLAANLIGGYVIGVVMAIIKLNPLLYPNLNLFMVTGFLGALTTFSTFSFEVVERLMEQQFGWAILIAVSHLIGALLMTWLGWSTMDWLR